MIKLLVYLLNSNQIAVFVVCAVHGVCVCIYPSVTSFCWWWAVSISHTTTATRRNRKEMNENIKSTYSKKRKCNVLSNSSNLLPKPTIWFRFVSSSIFKSLFFFLFVWIVSKSTWCKSWLFQTVYLPFTCVLVRKITVLFNGSVFLWSGVEWIDWVNEKKKERFGFCLFFTMRFLPLYHFHMQSVQFGMGDTRSHSEKMNTWKHR